MLLWWWWCGKDEVDVSGRIQSEELELINGEIPMPSSRVKQSQSEITCVHVRMHPTSLHSHLAGSVGRKSADKFKRTYANQNGMVFNDPGLAQTMV